MVSAALYAAISVSRIEHTPFEFPLSAIMSLKLPEGLGATWGMLAGRSAPEGMWQGLRPARKHTAAAHSPPVAHMHPVSWMERGRSWGVPGYIVSETSKLAGRASCFQTPAS